MRMSRRQLFQTGLVGVGAAGLGLTATPLGAVAAPAPQALDEMNVRAAGQIGIPRGLQKRMPSVTTKRPAGWFHYPIFLGVTYPAELGAVMNRKVARQDDGHFWRLARFPTDCVGFGLAGYVLADGETLTEQLRLRSEVVGANLAFQRSDEGGGFEIAGATYVEGGYALALFAWRGPSSSEDDHATLDAAMRSIEVGL